MEKEFVSYEQAVALRELGFYKQCLGFWNLYTNEFNYNPYPSNFTSEDVVPLPLKSQVFRWFEEKYGLYSYIFYKEDDDDFVWWIRWYVDSFPRDIPYELSSYEETQEEAEDVCIDRLIELAKQQ